MAQVEQFEDVEQNQPEISPEMQEIIKKAMAYDKLAGKYSKMISKLEGTSKQKLNNQELLRSLTTNVIGSKAGKDVSRVGWGSNIKAVKEQFKAFPKKYTGWETFEQDLDDDGIPEILINDADKVLRYVNGYSVKPSKHVKRSDYYGAYPTAAERSLNPKSKYFNGTDIDAEGNLSFMSPNAYRPKSKTGKEQQPKLKTLATEYLFRPFIKLFKEANKEIIDQIPKNIKGEIALLFNRVAWFNIRKGLYNALNPNNPMNDELPNKENQNFLTQWEKNPVFRKAFAAVIKQHINIPLILNDDDAKNLERDYNFAIDAIHNKYGKQSPL